MAADAKPAGVKDIQKFFDTPERPMGLADMKREWLGLPEADRREIAMGIGDGSLAYPARQAGPDTEKVA